MNRFTGLILALVLGAATGACASGGAGGASAEGIKPRDTKFTRDAARSIALAMVRTADEEKRQLYQQALENAKLAIQEDSANPQGWYIAGQAYANLGDFENADAVWDRAEALYPALGQDISSERETAWVQAYNEGVTAIQQDDIDAAIARMEKADLIYQGRPEAKLQLGVFYARKDQTEKAIAAYRGALEILRGAPPAQLDSATRADWEANEEIAIANLAQLLSATGRDAEAEQVFRDVLAANPNDLQAKINLAGVLAKQGKADEANALYAELVGRSDLSYNDYLMIGVGLFQAERYDGAVAAFRKAVQVNPYSRDGFYNLAQALYMQANQLDQTRKAARGAEAAAASNQLADVHEELAQAAEKVLELDPFNRNIIAYMARAYQALSDLTQDDAAKRRYRESIQGALRRHEEAPFEMMELTMIPGDDAVGVSGQIMNLKLATGEPIRLRISLLDSAGGVIGSQEVTISAPAANATATFEASVPVRGALAGWRYERVQ